MYRLIRVTLRFDRSVTVHLHCSKFMVRFFYCKMLYYGIVLVFLIVFNRNQHLHVKNS